MGRERKAPVGAVARAIAVAIIGKPRRLIFDGDAPINIRRQRIAKASELVQRQLASFGPLAAFADLLLIGNYVEINNRISRDCRLLSEQDAPDDPALRFSGR